MAADQEIVFPNGTGLFYYDTKESCPQGHGHSYWRRKEDGSRGKRLTGVTTSIKPIDFRPDGLMKWAARINGIGVADLIQEALVCEEVEELKDALGWATSYESIWSTLEESKLTFNDVRDRAATRGTNVHELALERLSRGEPVPDYEGMTEEEHGYAQAVSQWWLDYDPKPLNVEQIVYSDELGVAGRMDLRAQLFQRSKPVIVDLKTSQFIGPSAHVQLAAYDFCARECGVGGSEAQYILHVHEDGSYEFIKGVATHDDFLATVGIYRRAAQIRNAADKAWEKATKVPSAAAA